VHSVVENHRELFPYSRPCGYWHETCQTDIDTVLQSANNHISRPKLFVNYAGLQVAKSSIPLERHTHSTNFYDVVKCRKIREFFEF